MSIEFNYRITQMEREETSGFVVSVHFEVGAFDQELSTFYYGTVKNEQTEDSLVPYDELTEEIVISWIKESIDTESIESKLQAEIERQKIPAPVTGMPW